MRRAFAPTLHRFVLVLVVLLWGCGPSVPPLPPLQADDVVLAFGDSLTAGTGATAEESYPAVLAGLIGRKVVNSGVPGELSEQGLARLPDQLEEHRPRLMILCLGGNDILRKLDPVATEANLRSMVGLARARGIAVVMIAVPKASLFGGAAELYERVAGDLGVPLESAALSDILRDNNLKSDPVHPNAQGYRKLAEALAVLLKEAGAL